MTKPKRSARNTCKRSAHQNFKLIEIEEQKKLTLTGLKQFYVDIQEDMKLKNLVSLLMDVQYNQAFIFVKKVERAKKLHQLLEKMKLQVLTIHRQMTQERRIEQYKSFKEGAKRILVTTNLMARGIDINKVNLVINFDCPAGSDDYLHRVGRAGRFNTPGIAVTFVTTEEDKKVLKEIQDRFEVKITEFPKNIEEAKLL